MQKINIWAWNDMVPQSSLIAYFLPFPAFDKLILG